MTIDFALAGQVSVVVLSAVVIGWIVLASYATRKEDERRESLRYTTNAETDRQVFDDCPRESITQHIERVRQQEETEKAAAGRPRLSTTRYLSIARPGNGKNSAAKDK